MYVIILCHNVMALTVFTASQHQLWYNSDVTSHLLVSNLFTLSNNLLTPVELLVACASLPVRNSHKSIR